MNIRPSNAHIWVVCPGMVRLSQGALPDDDEDNTVREEGTACHWLAHWTTVWGDPVPEGAPAPNGVAVDSDMLDAVGMYLGAVKHWPNPRFEVAVKCHTIHPMLEGTPDVFSWDPATRTLRIGDLKYGYRYVAADGNWQLVCYVAGVMQLLGLTTAQVLRIELMICQPRAGGVRVATMCMARVLELWDVLRAAALEACSPFPRCVTNPHCVSCEGRHQCTALQSAALTVLDATHAATPDALPFAAAENELRMLKWAADIVNARIEGLEQQVVHGMTRKGESSRHWEMRSTPGRLAWRPESVPVVQQMAKLAGIQVMKPPQLVTPTQAKKLLGESLVNAHATRPPGARKLVPTDASRWARIFGESK